MESKALLPTGDLLDADTVVSLDGNDLAARDQLAINEELNIVSNLRIELYERA